MNYLTLDIGGSSIKYAIINKEGEFLEKGNAPAPKDGIDQFVSIIGDLYDKYKDNIVGMAISMPGAIDPDKDLKAEDRWQKDSSWGNYYVTTLHAPTPNNLRNALIYSDNVYFAKAATNIGKDDLISGYDCLEIGSKIPFELSLNAPQYQNKDSDFDDQQLADSGYGQGELLMNPVQLAAIYSAFVNEGDIIQPYLIMNEKPDQMWVENAFTKDTANTIKDDLIGVISDSNGTGHAIYHDDIELAGKTGTAEIKASQDDTTGTELGWFTVMTTNSDNPILITTMVENVKDRGGSGYVVDHMQAPLNSYLYQ